MPAAGTRTSSSRIVVSGSLRLRGCRRSRAVAAAAVAVAAAAGGGCDAAVARRRGRSAAVARSPWSLAALAALAAAGRLVPWSAWSLPLAAGCSRSPWSPCWPPSAGRPVALAGRCPAAAAVVLLAAPVSGVPVASVVPAARSPGRPGRARLPLRGRALRRRWRSALAGCGRRAARGSDAALRLVGCGGSAAGRLGRRSPAAGRLVAGLGAGLASTGRVGLAGLAARLGGLDRVDELALAHRAGALDAEATGDLLELGEQHAARARRRGARRDAAGELRRPVEGCLRWCRSREVLPTYRARPRIAERPSCKVVLASPSRRPRCGSADGRRRAESAREKCAIVRESLGAAARAGTAITGALAA